MSEYHPATVVAEVEPWQRAAAAWVLLRESLQPWIDSVRRFADWWHDAANPRTKAGRRFRRRFRRAMQAVSRETARSPVRHPVPVRASGRHGSRVQRARALQRGGEHLT